MEEPTKEELKKRKEQIIKQIQESEGFIVFFLEKNHIQIVEHLKAEPQTVLGFIHTLIKESIFLWDSIDEHQIGTIKKESGSNGRGIS